MLVGSVRRILRRPSTQLRDRCLLDVDGGLKGRLLEAVEPITLLHIRTFHEELLLEEGSDARHNVDLLLTLAAGLASLPRFLTFNERKQIGVHLVLERCAQAVRGALVDLQGRALDELGLEQAGVSERHDLVVVALHDERRYVKLLQVLGLIRLGECLDAEVCGREAGHHALQPERLAHPFRDLRARAVVAVERQAEILPELRAVGLNAGAELVEHFDRRAAWIGWRLQHQRRDGADQHGLGYTLRTVPADITSNLPATRGMADMNGILEIELLDELCEVVGVGVHVVAGPRLARTSVAAAVMCDATVSARSQKERLILERIRGERPTMAENYRLPCAPVLVVE